VINDLQPNDCCGRLRPILVYAVITTAACWAAFSEPTPTSGAGPRTHTVSIEGFKFVPDTLTVNAGDTIIWRNQDKAPHTATADGRVFDSGNIPYGASWEYVADREGNYPYICAFHPRMKATLVVR
jgi:plastocyanin